MTVTKYTVSCLFYLSYEDEKWVVEQEFPPIRAEAEDFETALREAMEKWIDYLKNTETGQKWIYLTQQEGKVTLWDLHKECDERD